ncbi:MAG: hypothetical protein GY780_00575 [bacterium]|nr:hypothetical protein [bacterium]
MILLANEVVVFLFLEAVLLVLLTVALVNTLTILKSWDFFATTTTQFALEKRAYLVVLVILGTLIFKILLLPFFSHTIDGLATIIPGAMCGAGVIESNGFGPALMVLKIVVLYLSGIWLFANREDLGAEDHPYFRAKLKFFLLIFVAVVLETVLDWLFFVNISTLTPVQCCSGIYGAVGEGNPLPLGLNINTLLMLFFLLYSLVVVLGLKRYNLLHLLASSAFLYFGYFAVVYFFGTYVYQLPTHKCPFCMLQKEYYYVGYLIWGSLLAGTFFGVAGFVLRLLLGHDVSFTQKWAVIFHTLFFLTCSLFVGIFFLRNGVLLQ